MSAQFNSVGCVHSGHILYALALHFDWSKNTMIPEYAGREIGGQADLVFCTPSGYLTEIEIKISRADWRRDEAKEKWKWYGPCQPPQRKHVSRFFYCVVQDLEDFRPEWMPPGAGVLVAREWRLALGASNPQPWRLQIKEVQAAKRLKGAVPLTLQQRTELRAATYYRYWHWQLNDMSHRFSAEFEKVKRGTA